MRAGACSRADSVCVAIAMALKLHILEPGLSSVLGTVEVAMLLRLVLSRAKVRALLFSWSPIMLC